LDTEPGPDPTSTEHTMDARWGSGRNMRDPIVQFGHWKHNKDGSLRIRFVYPGRLTPYIMDASPAEQRRRGFNRLEHIVMPYPEEGDKKVKLPNGKYRHISSFSLEELRKIGWDGAMTVSDTLQDAEYVPFVCGYDSDKDDEYEPVDVEKAKRRGLVGLPPGSGRMCVMATGQHVEINRDKVRQS